MVNHRPWTSNEIGQLRANAHHGADYCAALLNRTPSSVRATANRHRISLRQPGQRRGLLLGQPRSTSWLDQARNAAGQIDTRTLTELRERLLANPGEATETERRLAAAIGHTPTPICPACGHRPQTRTTTGLCDPCHLRHLADTHRHRTTTDHAQRQLWAARQAAHRTTTDPTP